MIASKSGSDRVRDLMKILTIAGIRGGAALLAFMTAIIATRIFAPEEFGKLSLLWSIATVAAVFLDLGTTIAYRKFGHDAVQTRKRIGRSLASYVARALAVLAALFLVVIAVPRNADLRIFFFAVPLALAFAIELLLAEIFRVRQIYSLAEFFSGGFRQLVYLFSLAVAALGALELEQFVASLSLSCLLLALLAVTAVGKPRYAMHPSYLLGWSSRAEGSEQFRFFLTQAMVLLGAQFPLLAAGLFASDEVAATVRISLLFGMLMQFAIAANALYFAPKLAQVDAGDHATLALLVRRSSVVGIAFIPAGLLLAALMPWLVSMMFGEAYMPSVPGAQIIVLAHAATSAFGAYGQMLLMRGWDRINLGGASTTVLAQAALLFPLREFAPVNGYVIAYVAGIGCAYAYIAYFGQRYTSMWPGGVRVRG